MSVKRKTFSIGDIAQMTSVTTRQIRNWEELGYLGHVERQVSGQRAYRRYSLDQLELIGLIIRYQDQGFTLKTAAQKANAELGFKGGNY
jgi:DNA-binding transcriptional MerR regulator